MDRVWKKIHILESEYSCQTVKIPDTRDLACTCGPMLFKCVFSFSLWENCSNYSVTRKSHRGKNPSLKRRRCHQCHHADSCLLVHNATLPQLSILHIFLFLLSLLSSGKTYCCGWFHQDIKRIYKRVSAERANEDSEIFPESGTDCQTTQV